MYNTPVVVLCTVSDGLYGQIDLILEIEETNQNHILFGHQSILHYLFLFKHRTSNHKVSSLQAAIRVPPFHQDIKKRKSEDGMLIHPIIKIAVDRGHADLCLTLIHIGGRERHRSPAALYLSRVGKGGTAQYKLPT